jgi:hypothetical protein
MDDHEDDDVILLLRAGIRDEIGEDAAGLHIRYADEVDGGIYVAGCAPAPFDGLVLLERFDPKIEIRETGVRVGRAILAMRRDLDPTIGTLTIGAERTAARAGVPGEHWEVVSYGDRDSTVQTRAVMTLTILDDALRPATIRVLFDETGPIDCLATMRALRGQRARREADGITVDPILASVMGDDLRALLDHLRDRPKDEATPAWDTGTWTNGRLARFGVDVPTCVETVRMKDGHVYGRVRLAAATTWTNGNLVHRADALPQSAINALVGRPLDDVVQSPHIPAGCVVETASMNLGSLRIGASANPVRALEKAA